jgi:preprotein translocase subunit SecD
MSRLAEACPPEGVLVPVDGWRCEPLPCPALGTEILVDQRADGVVRDLRVAWPWWFGATLDSVGHEGDATARFEEVVDLLGHPLSVGSMERLAERDESEHPEIKGRDFFRQAVDPFDVGDARPAGMLCSFGQHVGIGVQPDGLCEQRGQFDGQDSRTAADIEESAGRIESALGSHRLSQCQRVRRAPSQVERRAALVEGWVIRRGSGADRHNLEDTDPGGPHGLPTAVREGLESDLWIYPSLSAVRFVQTSVVPTLRRAARPLFLLASITVMSACTTTTTGATVAVFRPVHPVGAGELAADAATITKRLQHLGQSSDVASVRGTEVIVTGTPLRLPAADLARTGHFYLRPVLCGAPPFTPPAGGRLTLPNPVPSCGQDATTAANLAVNVNSGQPANDIPADPVFARYESSRNDDPGETVLLPCDPAAGAQQYNRFVLAKASFGATSISSASATFDTTINQWAVGYTLTSSGASAWDHVAEQNFHQYVALDLDGAVESAPLIQPDQLAFTSFGGRGEISGNFTAPSAKTLAALLFSGPLVAPLRPVSAS